MNRACSLLAGAGLGAGMMYLLDPQQGRRRRAMVRDKAVHLAHEARDAGCVVARDMRNRAQGLWAGDFSVLVGGRRAMINPLRGGWSPTARALMGMAGGALFLYGMTQRAPMACMLGTACLALAAEAMTNAGIDDLKKIPQQMADMAGRAAERMGFDGKHNAGLWAGAGV
jgi:hypothetical protein